MDEYTEYLRGFYEINCKSFAFSKWPPIRTIQFAELALAEIVSNDVEQQERGESSHLSTLQRPVKKTRATLDQVYWFDSLTAKKRVESILDFQLICHLHSGTKCLHTWYKLFTICTRM